MPKNHSAEAIELTPEIVGSFGMDDLVTTIESGKVTKADIAKSAMVRFCQLKAEEFRTAAETKQMDPSEAESESRKWLGKTEDDNALYLTAVSNAHHYTGEIDRLDVKQRTTSEDHSEEIRSLREKQGGWLSIGGLLKSENRPDLTAIPSHRIFGNNN